MKTFLFVLFIGSVIASGQTYDTNNIAVQTFAGSGFSGHVDGQGVQTMFNDPAAITADSSSNLFVLDVGNLCVRKITPDGTVSSYAGGGSSPAPGFGTNVSLNSYSGIGAYNSIVVDHSNVLWVTAGTTLFRVATNGYVTVTNPGISYPRGLCIDSSNNLYISDSVANKIYRWRANGIFEVFAGSGNQGGADGNGVFNSFYGVDSLAADSADNIYVWDFGSMVVRKINQNRDVVTIAGKFRDFSSPTADGQGTNASFYNSQAGATKMCADNLGNILVANGYSIRKLSADTNVTTMAGSFTQTGYANGAGNAARFDGAVGICVSGGTIFLADQNNQRVRTISFSPPPSPSSAGYLNIAPYAGATINGIVGRTYQIQSSTDQNNWVTETNVILTSSPYRWVAPAGTGTKSYRALLLP